VEQRHGLARRRTGALGLAFQGVPNIPESGLPIPVTAIHGDLVGALRRTAEPRWRVGATNLAGAIRRNRHGLGADHGADLHERASRPRVRRRGVDALDRGATIPWRTALEANHALRWLWPAFSPSAGTASADWRLRAGC
jgi:hypothetical protein